MGSSAAEDAVPAATKSMADTRILENKLFTTLALSVEAIIVPIDVLPIGENIALITSSSVNILCKSGGKLPKFSEKPTKISVELAKIRIKLAKMGTENAKMRL